MDRLLILYFKTFFLCSNKPNPINVKVENNKTHIFKGDLKGHLIIMPMFVSCSADDKRIQLPCVESTVSRRERHPGGCLESRVEINFPVWFGTTYRYFNFLINLCLDIYVTWGEPSIVRSSWCLDPDPGYVIKYFLGHVTNFCLWTKTTKFSTSYQLVSDISVTWGEQSKSKESNT